MKMVRSSRMRTQSPLLHLRQHCAEEEQDGMVVLKSTNLDLARRRTLARRSRWVMSFFVTYQVNYGGWTRRSVAYSGASLCRRMIQIIRSDWSRGLRFGQIGVNPGFGRAGQWGRELSLLRMWTTLSRTFVMIPPCDLDHTVFTLMLNVTR